MAERAEPTAAERLRNNILCSVIALVALGFVMSDSVAAARATDLRLAYAALLKQAVITVLGVGAMLLLARVDYHLLYRWRWHLFFGSMGLLVLVLAPGIGVQVNGARRWIRFMGQSVQPSELAKLALVAVLAGYAVNRQDAIESFFGGFAPAMVAVGLCAGLVLLEPDFGTAALLGAVGTIVLVVAGARVSHVLILGMPAAAGLAFLICKSPNRLGRILAFLDPWAHYDGPGYQLVQSLVGLGSGGFLGVGLGGSMQKLYFLPEPGSDFVLAVLGEEMGLIGTLGVLAFFSLLVIEGVRLSGRAPDLFGSLLAFGITLCIGLQAAINIAVVTASVPTKGIPLPFISAGGTSLFFNMVGVGVLLNIARHAMDAELQGESEPASDPGAST